MADIHLALINELDEGHFEEKQKIGHFSDESSEGAIESTPLIEQDTSLLIPTLEDNVEVLPTTIPSFIVASASDFIAMLMGSQKDDLKPP